MSTKLHDAAQRLMTSQAVVMNSSSASIDPGEGLGAGDAACLDPVLHLNPTGLRTLAARRTGEVPP